MSIYAYNLLISHNSVSTAHLPFIKQHNTLCSEVSPHDFCIFQAFTSRCSSRSFLSLSYQICTKLAEASCSIMEKKNPFSRILTFNDISFVLGFCLLAITSIKVKLSEGSQKLQHLCTPLTSSHCAFLRLSIHH